MKKISINKLEKTYQKKDISIPLEGVEDVVIEIKHTLSLEEILAFSMEVVDACVDELTGSFTPEVYDFVIRCNALTRYANFTLPTNIVSRYDLVYNTSAYDQVMQNINCRQYQEIIAAIDKKIEHKLALIRSTAVSKMNELIDTMDNYSKSMLKAFGNVGKEDLSEFIKKVNEMDKVDERKLADAVLENQKREKAEASDNVISIQR